jgi:Outer membrane lipoprotein-sorting protein
MSRERTNVIGIVALTVCVGAAAVVGGWLAASRYLGLGQQTVTAAPENAPAAPTPVKKASHAPRSDGGPAGQPNGTSKDAGSSGAPAAAKKDTAAHDTNEPVSTTPPAADPQPDAAPARAAAETPLPSTAVASSTAPTTENLTDARGIVEESQRRSEARFYQYDGLLQSYDTSNAVTEKRWTFDRQGSHGQSKSVLRFTAPPEVKGVALLILNHPERASDQWMWTPAIERDRRIALQDRSTRFFGTDFTFEDLEERDVDQYDHTMLGADNIDGAACWKIQSTPKKTRSSQYTRSIIWIRKDNYTTVRLDNFVKDEVVRRLLSSNLENIQGIWTARLLDMTDLRRGTHTRLTLQQVKYNSFMKDEAFTLQAIRR